MFATIRSALQALLEVGATRLELITTEVEEERLRLADLLLMACVALFFLALGLMLTAAFLVVLFWDSHRLLTLGLLSAGFLGIGLFSGWCWRVKAASKPRFLAATLTELGRDVEALRPRDGQQRSL
ncbi:MAG: phage holin family protein [Burkholderiaceae bacterium]|nr:phage holin family protein [Burkholderiaceae bacterium]MDH3460992.1 phage holin family protein [Burkholderiaceae bacterium]